MRLSEQVETYWLNMEVTDENLDLRNHLSDWKSSAKHLERQNEQLLTALIKLIEIVDTP